MDGTLVGVKALTPSVKRKKRPKRKPRESSFCRKLTRKGITREKRRKLKKVKYIGSLFQNLQDGLRILKSMSESKDNLEQTICLSDGESVNECSKNSVICQSVGADSESKTNQDCEVIDLTENVSPDESPHDKSLTVIDITEDDKKPEVDDISIIGTYKTARSFFNPGSKSCKIVKNSEKSKKKYSNNSPVLGKISNLLARKRNLKNLQTNKVSRVGENVYVNSPVTLPLNGLRPIIIDGSNVAYVRSNCNFCCKRLEICINYFKEKGHKVTAFVPQFRTLSNRNDNPQLLMKLERQGDVVLTPSKTVDGVNIVPYDDRFIVQTAVLKGGVIVSRDNYRDLLKENPAWAETIKYRVLGFIWVDDVLMFPRDPLGEFGPSLEEFLRFN